MHLYILIFWKGKTKNKFAETKRFSMWKTCYYHAANDCLITVENCIFKTSLPFFKVFYQCLSHRANITAKQNHCRRQYHRRRLIAPSAHRFCPRQKHRFIAFTMCPLLCSSQWHSALHIIKNLTKSTRLGAKYSSLKTARMRRTTSLLKSRYRKR